MKLTIEQLKRENIDLIIKLNRIFEDQAKDEMKRIKRLLSPSEPLSPEDRDNIIEHKRRSISGYMDAIKVNNERIKQLREVK